MMPFIRLFEGNMNVSMIMLEKLGRKFEEYGSASALQSKFVSLEQAKVVSLDQFPTLPSVNTTAPHRDLSNNHSHNYKRLCSRCWGIPRISKPTSNRLRGVFRIGQHLHKLLTFVVRTNLLLWHRRQMTKVRCLGTRRFKRKRTSVGGVENLRSGQLRRLRIPNNGNSSANVI